MLFWIIFICWLSLDLLSKYIAVQHLSAHIPLIWDFLYLELIYNSGIAFGTAVPSLLLKYGTIALIIWIYYYYRTQRTSFSWKNLKLIDISAALVLSWAVWNGYERFMYWKVVDFIGVQYFSIFNIADSLISIWWVLLVYTLYQKK